MSITNSKELENLDINSAKNTIQSGNAIMGIEMGSTRIKAVLIDEIIIPLLLEVTIGKTALKTVFGLII